MSAPDHGEATRLVEDPGRDFQLQKTNIHDDPVKQ